VVDLSLRVCQGGNITIRGCASCSRLKMEFLLNLRNVGIYLLKSWRLRLILRVKPTLAFRLPET
jgi:Tfp pilus assembly protein PilN